MTAAAEGQLAAAATAAQQATLQHRALAVQQLGAPPQLLAAAKAALALHGAPLQAVLPAPALLVAVLAPVLQQELPPLLVATAAPPD